MSNDFILRCLGIGISTQCYIASAVEEDCDDRYKGTLFVGLLAELT